MENHITKTMENHIKSIDDEMARAMHVISDSDNTATLSKALGRYSKLELTESIPN